MQHSGISVRMRRHNKCNYHSNTLAMESATEQSGCARMHSMNWDDMRILEACARAGSFSKAGKELQLNHGSISRRMTQLENNLGVTIFRRTSSGVQLTNTGRLIADQATSMATAALVVKNTSGVTDSVSGKIRFQTVDTMGLNLMVYLREFAQLYPAVEVDLVLSQDFADLSRGEADVVLRSTNKPDETFVGQRLAKHAVGIFGTSDVLARHPKNTPLSEFPWIAWGNGLSDPWFEKYLPNARITMRVNTAHGVAQAIRSGIGVGHLACYPVATEDDFLCLQAPDPSLELGLWLLAHRSVRRNKKVRVFMAFLREKIRQDKEIIEGRVGSPTQSLDIPLLYVQ
jgi:DNA-binding transcriptional LysR family regulator